MRCYLGGQVQNCIITGNSADEYGGGVYYRGELGDFYSFTIQNCIISKNSASSGGGILCYNGGEVQNCIISGNSADWEGGGMDCYLTTIQNCIINGNVAHHSGGVDNYYGTILNCTIIDNSAINNGGVNCVHNSKIQNSILWNNTNGNYFSSDSINHYNCIENWTILNNGIITNNPQFISNTDFRLQNISPSRNSGTNAHYVFSIFDLDGNSRIMGTTVDMGAYEYVEAFKYPPFRTPIINDTEIDLGKIGWTPSLNENPRAEDFVVQEQLGGTQGIWSTVYIGTNTSLLIQRLANAYYRVAAHNTIGYKWSDIVFYSNYPINVTSLNVLQTTNESGYVSIQTKINDDNLDLSALKIEYSLNNGTSWANGDPFLISITQNGQSPSINNSSEYQANDVLPNNSNATILWDTKSLKNGNGPLTNQIIEQAKIKVTPRNSYSQGSSILSSAFVIDNLIYTPNTPSNILPINGATNQSLTLSLQSSAFSDSNIDNTHSASRWQISKDISFSSIIYDSNEISLNKTNLSVPNSVLNYSTKYYWHVKYKNNHNNWSLYSDGTFFYTIDNNNIYYVSKTGENVTPYDTWEKAANNIQNAIDIADAGSIILVNNGTYYLESSIIVKVNMTVKSVNGAYNTIIVGNNKERCIKLNSRDILNGFTVKNGNANNSFGGGVYCEGAIVQNCIILSNSATHAGGGVSCSHGIVENSILSENSAYSGGDLSCSYGIINNCTINSIKLSNGGVYITSSAIQNSIIWNNISNNYFSPNSTNLYNCIKNWTNLVNGIITNNPEFRDSVSGDYRLESFSPCINTGTNMSWMWSATDLDGNPRIIDGIVDMGAYEYIPEPCIFVIYYLSYIIYYLRRKI